MAHRIVLGVLAMLAVSGWAQAQPSDEALATVYNALEDPCDFAVFAQSYPDSAFAPMAERRGAACAGDAPTSANAPITGMPVAASSGGAIWRQHDDTAWDVADSETLVGNVLRDASYAQLAEAARAGDGTAALIAGLARWDGFGVYRHRAEAVAMFERACEAGSVHGCAQLGYAYTTDGPIAEDLVRARGLLDAACSQGDLFGCSFLGYLYAVGAGGVAEDDRRAVALYRRACDGGVEGAGCGQLGFMYANGHGVTTEYARANQLLRRGCEGGYSVACSNLAMAYFRGRGVALDDERAAELWEQACRLENGFACEQAGRNALGVWGAPRNEDAAFEFFERGCAANFEDACTRLADLRARVQDRGTPARSRYPWIEASGDALGAACRNGQDAACAELALQRGDFQDAIPTLRRLCAAGDAYACGRWGHTYTLGHGRDDWSAAEAVDQLAGACEAGETWACGVAAMTLWPEAATREDLQRVRHLGHRACRSDVTLGCTIYAASYVLTPIVDTPAAEVEVERVLGSHCASASPGDLGQTEACWAVSVIYQTERGVAANPGRARANAELACAAGQGVMPACRWLQENG